jgi:predicted DNA-binding ribbon-helix-helix protein
VNRTQIILDNETHKKLKRIAKLEKRSLSDLVREILSKDLAERERQALSDAARLLLVDYQTDAELIAFTSLDGDDFNV